MGKTYAWQKTIDAYRGEDAFLRTRYSYVSAFGMQSIKELKSAILQSVDTLDDPDPGNRWKTFAEQLFDDGFSLKNMEKASTAAKRVSAKAVGNAKAVMSAIPVVEKLAHFGERISFQAIRNQIICIDDIERASTSLGISSILGVATELKEQRSCKVILLLNKEGLGEEEKVFDVYLEKVSDRAIIFEPTLGEAAQSALGSDAMDSLLKKRATELGITNIRVIGRIRNLLRLLEPKLDGMHEAVIDQVVASFAIIGWGLFEPKLGPNMDELKGFNGLSESIRKIVDKDYKTPEMSPTRKIANKYGFTIFDGLDHQILEGMQSGWFKDENLIPLLTKMESDARVHGLRQAIQAPWDIIFSSFNDNLAEVVEALCRTARDYADYMSPMQITDRATILEELGHENLAREIIQKYLEVLGKMTSEDIFALSSADAEAALVHPSIKSLIAQKAKAGFQAADPKSILKKISLRGGWNNEQIEFLAGLPAKSFVEMIDELDGREEISAVLYAALNFEKYTEQNYKIIAGNMRQALQEIGARNKLDGFRVRKFIGAQVGDGQPAQRS